MFHKIKKVEAISNMILKIEFQNGQRKYYDVKKIVDEIEEFNILKNENIFNKVNVDKGGYAVIWNENIDIECEELYKNGVDNLDNNKGG